MNTVSKINWIRYNNILKTQTFANLCRQYISLIFKNHHISFKQKLILLYNTQIKKEHMVNVDYIKANHINTINTITITIYGDWLTDKFFRIYTKNIQSNSIRLFTNDIYYFRIINDYRYFLHFGNNCFRLELVFGMKARYLKMIYRISNDSEDTVYFSFGIPFIITVYLILDHNKISNMLESITGKYNTREYGFCIIFDKYPAIEFSFHSNPNGNLMNNKLWHGWSKYYTFETLLKGESKVSNQIISHKTISFIMPANIKCGYKSKKYNANVTKIQYITKYSHWFQKKWFRWIVEVKEGIPHPGKGTCGHNCGETKTYSISFSTKSLISNEQDAISAFIIDINDIRNKYPL